MFLQPRLVVEQIDLRRTARLMQEDDTLCLRREVRQAHESAGLGIPIENFSRGIGRKQRSERGHAETGARLAKKCLRVRADLSSACGSMGLLLRDGLIEVENDARNRGPGSELGAIELLVEL